ncbi:hypothetical protein ABIB06_007373 [Bradyrhizobium sp. LB8.2]|uniref:hypothetical protein n=1 Tax=unclassified Bradyrhizobium TaxID=2631580 RepID=UPI0033999175
MTREDQLTKLARQADEQNALAERERKFHEMQDSYYIHYAIEDTQLTILFAAFKLMTIPYFQIVEIEVASIFDKRSTQINLGNGIRQMCRIKKSRGWFRYVIVTPREPKLLLDAFHTFRSRANPVKSDTTPPLPQFLSPHDNS